MQQFVHSIKMQKILLISYEPDVIHWVQLCRSDIDKCFHHGQTLSKLNQNAMTNLVRAMDPDALAPIASKRVSVLCMIHEHSRRSKATHATLQTKSLPTLKLLLLYSHTELKYFSYFIYFSCLSKHFAAIRSVTIYECVCFLFLYFSTFRLSTRFMRLQSALPWFQF